jgi:hypothetical protein
MQASQPLMHVASCLVCPTVDDQKSVTHTRTCVQAAGFVVAFAAGRHATHHRRPGALQQAFQRCPYLLAPNRSFPILFVSSILPNLLLNISIDHQRFCHVFTSSFNFLDRRRSRWL